MVYMLLVVWFLNGAPQYHALRAESMEECWAAVPAVASHMPENGVITCLQLRDEKST